MKWFLGVLLLLAAALALDSGLLAYTTYVLLGLLLLSRVLARSWVENLSATRSVRMQGGRDGDKDPGRDITAEVGQRVTIRIVVSNAGNLPVPWVLLEDLLPKHALDRRFPRLRIKGKRLHLGMIRAGGETELKYQVECLSRGYYQIGPAILENGDLFGLHRRFRVVTEVRFLLVYPRIVLLEGYDLTSRRPIGEVRFSHRLHEDPTRIAGVRPYESGDPLNRIHWRATARTGSLHSKLYEPSTLAGATIALDLHASGYPSRGEPHRSELAVTTAVSLVAALCQLNQQVGLVTNGANGAERIRRLLLKADPRTRQEAQAALAEEEEVKHVAPLVVETRRGIEQLQKAREVLAIAEVAQGLSFSQLLVETAGRMPRDATLVAVLPAVPEEASIALGGLRRQGMAVTVVLIMLDDNALEDAMGRLFAEGIRDVRHLPNEALLPDLCRQHVDRSAPYQVV
jgi:uncharacterized protein (DUF58 family)